MRRVSSATTETALESLQVELVDRFGVLPEPARRLFAVTRLKLLAQRLGVRRLDLGMETGRLEFADRSSVDPIAVIQLMQRQPQIYRMDGPSTLRIRKTLPAFDERLAFAETLCTTLMTKESTRPEPSAVPAPPVQPAGRRKKASR